MYGKMKRKSWTVVFFKSSIALQMFHQLTPPATEGDTLETLTVWICPFLLILLCIWRQCFQLVQRGSGSYLPDELFLLSLKYMTVGRLGGSVP